jgi:DNA polymerase-3 subunit delta'
MTLAAVTGQPRAVEALRSALRSGNVHHAYLFTGPEGVGKELAAVGLAQALNCLDQPGEGCGACESCAKIAHRNHPDLTWVMPEDEQVSRGLAGRSDFSHTPSRDIRVEQIRSLQERLALRSLEGRRKIAILASAQAMNPQAQNAFLKTLEEPPAETVLVLLASSPDKLLPTLRSRCSQVHFGPLPPELIAATLKEKHGLEGPEAALAAAMSGGSLGKALSLDVEGLKARREVIEQFEALEAGDSRPWLRFAESYSSSREEALGMLEILQVWLHDVAAAQLGVSAGVNRDLAAQASSAALRVRPEALHRRKILVEQAANAIGQRNGAARLQLERMLIEMLA